MVFELKIKGSANTHINGSGHFFLTDLLVLLSLGSCLQTLPGQAASQKVHHDIPQRLHIVPSALLNAQMSVYGCIACCPSEILVLPVRDMHMGLWVSVFFCKPKVNYVHLVCLLSETHEEVVWFDIAVDETSRVHKLHTT
jgi:hypothetical protein